MIYVRNTLGKIASIGRKSITFPSIKFIVGDNFQSYSTEILDSQGNWITSINTIDNWIGEEL